MHPHRSSALGYASAASAAHSRVYGACAAEAAAGSSESSGLSVGGCIRAWEDFGPHPVFTLLVPYGTRTNIKLSTLKFDLYDLQYGKYTVHSALNAQQAKPSWLVSAESPPSCRAARGSRTTACLCRVRGRGRVRAVASRESGRYHGVPT